MGRLRVALGVVAGIRGGPGTYGIELVRALGQLASSPEDTGGLELEVLTDRPEVFEGVPRVRTHALPLASSWGQPWWDNVLVPRALARLDVDLYHGTKSALPLLGLPRSLASVVTVHDLAHLSEPESFSAPQRWQLAVHLRHAARRSTRIACVSRATADDACERLGVAPERLGVTPLGVSPVFRPPASEAARAAARRRFGAGAGGLVAFVGTMQPRKRIEVAVAALERLRAQGVEATLVIAGRRRPGFDAPWLRSPPAHVRILGEIAEADLVDLYGAADAMVSPSTFEGFGLTFAEAMACGCPVVGVAATSVPEVVGDGGILVPRSEPGLVAAALAELLGDAARREEVAHAARRRAAGFTWERCARATLELYAEAVASRPRLPARSQPLASSRSAAGDTSLTRERVQGESGGGALRGRGGIA